MVQGRYQNDTQPGNKWSTARYQRVHGHVPNGPGPVLNGRYPKKLSTTRNQMVHGPVSNGAQPGTKLSRAKKQMVYGSVPNGSRSGTGPSFSFLAF